MYVSRGDFRSRVLWWGIALAWTAAVFTGLALVWRYKATPGAEADAPRTWPAASSVRHVPGRPTLVMFAHPKCPCTRASLDELATLTSRNRHQASCTATNPIFVPREGAKQASGADNRFMENLASRTRTRASALSGRCQDWIE